MRDIDLNATFAAQSFNTKVSEYWVSPWLEGSVATFVYSKRRWWVSHGEPLLNRVVTETADSFMRVLAEKWPGLETENLAVDEDLQSSEA